MMKTYLKRAFQLSDSGVKGLAKSIWSFFLYYVSFVPPMICVFLFADRLLNGNTGKPVVYLLFMLAATLVMYLVINYNYKTTYDETYQESATLRIDLAEQLSKLPLSYFSKHNLSDLAQTIMADVASIEHAFANAVANSIGFAIYFLVISVALLIMNWKLGLCVLLPVLTSASVLFLTKKLQVRDVNKHYDKLRDISESFQNAIELNQEIKSYGLKEKVEAQMDQQLDESENLQWKAQIIQTIPVTIGQTLSILPVELNPISCSMCYVNNSIYTNVVPEISECQHQLMMGVEFCYDAIANPKNYDMLRISNKNYTYVSDNQYSFL